MIYFDEKPIIKSIFPNKEKQYEDLLKGASGKKSHDIRLIFEGNDDLFDLAMIKHWFDDNMMSEATIRLTMPFCPYGQMDRKINGSMFSFKYFAQFINLLNFDVVIIYDPHSSVMPALLNHCIVKYPMHGICLTDYDIMFCPDNGAAKKYSEIYDYACCFGNKKRNLETGEIIKYEVLADKEDIDGKSILIRDDLIIRGGTYKYAAQALKDMGAKQVDLYITHIMPSAQDFCKNYKKYGIDNFYSANTLQVPFF